jgi:ABC-type branched-subunit amino acid transport system substrate-binding protein
MRVRLAAAGTALALVLAACGNAGDDSDTGGGTTAPGGTGDVSEDQLDEFVPIDEVGVTDTEIRVSVITAATNPLGGKYREFADGIEAYFEMVNSEGGIYGRDLTIAKVRDDQVVANQREVLAALDEDNPFAVFVAALLFTGATDLAAENVPTFGWNINPEWTGPPNFFPNLGSICFGCTGKTIPWLAKELGATKVGVLGYGVSPQSKLCAEGNRKSFERYAQESGAEVVYYDDTLPFGVTDLSAHVAAMREAGVEFITTCMDINGVFTLAQEMDKQGLEAVQHMPQGYDLDFIARSGGVFEGNYIIPQFVAWQHEPQPDALQQFFDWMDQIGKEPVELSMQGWIAADQFYTGLKLAGPEFDRQKLIDALNTMTAYTAGGLIQPIDWTRQHEDPKENVEARGELGCQNFVQVRGTELVSVFNEDGKPWLCWHARDEEWEEPTSYSFVDFEGTEG